MNQADSFLFSGIRYMDFFGSVYLVLGGIGLIGALWEEIDTFLEEHSWEDPTYSHLRIREVMLPATPEEHDDR